MPSSLTLSWLSRSPRVFRLGFNCWLPAWANGIKLTYVSPDFSQIDARISLKRRSANAVGTMFGGSLFTFTDPFYMIILLRLIGKNHYVWDKSTSIDFVSPGRKDINYSFKFTKPEIEDIVEKCRDGSPLLKKLHMELKDDDGKVVAKVEKVVYIRRKKEKEPSI